jgi:aminopeptidase-like protein
MDVGNASYPFIPLTEALSVFSRNITSLESQQECVPTSSCYFTSDYLTWALILAYNSYEVFQDLKYDRTLNMVAGSQEQGDWTHNS